MATIWALIDHRPGTANQVLGLAQHTGFHIVEKKIDYNRLSRIPNQLQCHALLRFRHYALLGLKRHSKAHIMPPYPDIVIAAGRRAARISVFIKRQHPQTKIVHIMQPEMPLDYFDLVLLPRHDMPSNEGNVIATFGALHNLTDASLFAARARLPLNPDILPRPWTLLCLGGNTPHGNFKLSDANRLVDHLAPMAQEGGTLLITSSRRTPSALLRAATEQLRKHYPKWQLSIYGSDQGGENPYHAWLAQADRVIITADSISMLCEAAYTGKPLYVYAPHEAMSEKHRRFMKEMIESDYARNIVDYQPLWTGGLRLDEAGRIARDIIALVD